MTDKITGASSYILRAVKRIILPEGENSIDVSVGGKSVTIQIPENKKDTMTLGAVKEYIANMPDDLEVKIPNHRMSMGPTSATPVSGLYRGIDWDSKTFFIVPETKMQNMGQEPIPNKQWQEDARQWAEKQMPENWNRKDEILMGSFYGWMLMFIRDQYNLFRK